MAKDNKSMSASGDVDADKENLASANPQSSDDGAAANGGETAVNNEQVCAVKTVRMHRGEAIHSDHHGTADVHPDEVDNYIAGGWRVTE